ncbi:MAG: hypothetical protein ACT4P4_30010 [Betaproteobacteria bacterium]
MRRVSERYVADLSRHEDRIAEARAEAKRMREEKDRLEDDLRTRLGQLRFETAL